MDSTLTRRCVDWAPRLKPPRRFSGSVACCTCRLSISRWRMTDIASGRMRRVPARPGFGRAQPPSTFSAVHRASAAWLPPPPPTSPTCAATGTRTARSRRPRIPPLQPPASGRCPGEISPARVHGPDRHRAPDRGRLRLIGSSRRSPGDRRRNRAADLRRPFAAVQLWANNASNTLLRWAANQIDSNRWHVAGLLDGRLRSLLIATGWTVGGFFSLGLSGARDRRCRAHRLAAYDRDRRRCHHRRHRLLPGPVMSAGACFSIGRQRLGLADRRARLPSRRMLQIAAT